MTSALLSVIGLAGGAGLADSIESNRVAAGWIARRFMDTARDMRAAG
jgi:hypothetical protein